MEWLFAAFGVVAGMIVGALLARAGSSAKELKKELEQANQELSAYRSKVTQHFARTAELVEVLAANSRDIYRHLATGSQELCNGDAMRLNEAVLKPLPEAAVLDEQRPPDGQTADVAAPPAGGGETAAAAPQQQTPKPPDKELDQQADKTKSKSAWSEILPDAEEGQNSAHWH